MRSRAGSRLSGQVRRIEQHHAKDYGESLGGNESCEKSSSESAERGGDLKEHSDADVGESLLHVGSSGARGGCDNGNQGSADGVADVNLEKEGEQRDEDDSAAQAGE